MQNCTGPSFRERRHAPAYALEVDGQWRVVVPIYGRLCPRMLPLEFDTRGAAQDWLASPDGVEAVSEARERREGPRGIVRLAARAV